MTAMFLEMIPLLMAYIIVILPASFIISMKILHPDTILVRPRDFSKAKKIEFIAEKIQEKILIEK